MIRSSAGRKLFFATAIAGFAIAVALMDVLIDVPGRSYHVQAPMMAMLGAATLFVGLMRSGITKLDKSVNILGIVLVLSTGTFWLLDATDGDIGPYFVFLVLSVPIIVTPMLSGIILGRTIRNAQRKIPDWWLAIEVGTLALVGLAIFILFQSDRVP